MEITYVAKHDARGNEDEVAITYALGKLGHKVNCVQEYAAAKHYRMLPGKQRGILLFHKWLDVEILSQVKIPKVFWYFDRVDFEYTEMNHLSRVRKAWMNLATELADVGFCTDGDWVNQDKTGKLVRLTQGADERVTGFPKFRTGRNLPSIMFSGSVGWGGKGRKTFVQGMQERDGNDFNHVRNRYRNNLAQDIQDSKIVVAPDFPCSDHYWSNRVYMALGFGAFMLHPWCRTLDKHYSPKELHVYGSREELHSKIAYWLKRPDERAVVQQAAFSRTRSQHLYRHRCEELIKTVEERCRVLP